MDLNYLHQRERMERACAATAASPDASARHGELADMFRDRIDFRRRVLRAGAGTDPAPHRF